MPDLHLRLALAFACRRKTNPRFFPFRYPRSKHQSAMTHALNPLKTTHRLGRVVFFSALSLLLVFAASCGKPSNEAQIEKLENKVRSEESKIRKSRNKISDFYDQIAELGGDTLAAVDTVHITTTPVVKEDFEEFIEVAAVVDSRDNLVLSSDMGGRVTTMRVKEGDRVSRGQLLAEVDAELVRDQIAELENQLELAQTVFEKRDRLWQQEIGSEIEWLQARNNVESLEKSLATAQTQLSKAALRSPISGTVDKVFVNQGEMAGPGAPVVRVVNLSKVQVRSDVSEAYLGKVSRGDTVKVHFPNIGATYESRVSAVGQVIDPNNRTFSMEVAINNADGKLKPNQVGTIRLRNRFEPNQVQVPSRLVQSAFSGDFLYVMDPKSHVALRRSVELGPSYDGMTVVRSGLKAGELLVDDGFRNVSDSTLVAVSRR